MRQICAAIPWCITAHLCACSSALQTPSVLTRMQSYGSAVPSTCSRQDFLFLKCKQRMQQHTLQCQEYPPGKVAGLSVAGNACCITVLLYACSSLVQTLSVHTRTQSFGSTEPNICSRQGSCSLNACNACSRSPVYARGNVTGVAVASNACNSMHHVVTLALCEASGLVNSIHAKLRQCCAKYMLQARPPAS